MATGQITEVAGAARLRGMAGGEEGDGGYFALVEGAGAFDYHQTARAGESGLQRFEGIDRYAALVEASVLSIGFFGVGKRGVVPTFCVAAW